MARLTITLSDSRHRALKEAAVRQGKTIRQVIEESLERCGIKTLESAATLVARARRNAGCSADEAMDRAVTEVRKARGDVGRH